MLDVKDGQLVFLNMVMLDVKDGWLVLFNMVMLDIMNGQLVLLNLVGYQGWFMLDVEDFQAVLLSLVMLDVMDGLCWMSRTVSLYCLIWLMLNVKNCWFVLINMVYAGYQEHLACSA